MIARLAARWGQGFGLVMLVVVVLAAAMAAAWLLDGMAFRRGVQAENARMAQANAQALVRAQAQAQADAQAVLPGLHEQLRLSRSYQVRIEERLRHAQLAVARPAPRAAPPVCAASAPAEVAIVLVQPPRGDGDDDVQLTLGAVSLWNSALARADVPAGACRADAAAEPACAAGSGLQLEDAWANHARNAEACAADRARHTSLIDYLQRREARQLQELQ